LERSSRHLSSSSSAPRLRGLSWRARTCIVAGGILCAGVVGPGTASAADPVGVDRLAGQIEAAVFSELGAAVPQPAAVSSSGGAEDDASIEQATAEGISAEATRAAAPTTYATSSPSSSPDSGSVGTPSAVASAWVIPAAPAGAAKAPPPSAGPGVVHVVPGWARTRKQSSRSSARTAVLDTRVSLAVRATARSSTSTSYGMTSVRQRAQAVATTSSRGGSSGAGSRERPSNVPSRRLPQPPAPGPERPDMSSPAQGGGSGVLLPLVIAALGAALALLGLELLPRVLPLPALRKPRRIVLPPWHPG
jgi:hypothetical protein